jgi:hypothetical protein
MEHKVSFSHTTCSTEKLETNISNLLQYLRVFAFYFKSNKFIMYVRGGRMTKLCGMAFKGKFNTSNDLAPTTKSSHSVFRNPFSLNTTANCCQRDGSLRP